MKFEEIFKKYKMGTANEDEKAFVEEEMKKYELINQYQIEDFLRKENEESLEGVHKDHSEEVKNIKKTVNKKLAKVVVISVAVVMLLAGVVNYVALPLYDQSFYNPGKDFDPHNDGDGKFQKDVNAFTELHYPGVTSAFGKIKHSGIGTYDISFYRGDQFGFNEHFKTKMIRGKIADRDDFLRGSFFTLTYMVMPWFKENLEDLEKLPKSSEIKAYIKLQEGATLKTVSDLKVNHPDVNFDWIGMKVNDSIKTKPNSEGQYTEYPGFGGAGVSLSWGDLQEGINSDHQTAGLNVTKVETYFKSLLKELTDAKDFLDSIDAEKLRTINTEKPKAPLSEKTYEYMLNYVEKNGVMPNYILIEGNVDEVTALLKDNEVTGIDIRDAKLSKWSGFDNK